jgi:hypothetical protein
VAVEVATSLAPLHRWETCLVNFPASQGRQPTVTQLDLRDVQTQANPPIVARYFAFQYPDTNQTQVVLYWYETAKFNVNGTTQTMNVKMSLVNYPPSTSDVSQAESYLLPFAAAINDYWQPIQTWAIVAIILSQNGLVLSSMAAAVLVAIIAYGQFLGRRQKSAVLRLYGKLSQQDQLLIKAVSNAQKLKNSSTRSVAAEYERLTKSQSSESWVTNKLSEAEDAGLVKRVPLNLVDQPMINWFSQVQSGKSFREWLRI